MQQSYKAVINTRQQFDSAISYLYNERGEDVLAVLGFIHKKIRQFHLNTDVYIVINEVYFRGLKFLDNGGEIYSPFPWIRQTAYNIIREMSRMQKNVIVNSEVLEKICLSTADVEPMQDSEQPEWLLLNSAFAELRPDEQKILKLRWIEDSSWKEIAQVLSHNSEKVKADTARKRGARALQSLRTHYQSVKQEPSNS
ncbi:MAG: sigma-70 family RNA polymerase sigma factor [Cyanobacteria bacterium J06560_5]